MAGAGQGAGTDQEVVEGERHVRQCVTRPDAPPGGRRAPEGRKVTPGQG